MRLGWVTSFDLLTSGKFLELPFERVDPGEIGCGIVIAATLARHQPESVLGKTPRGTRPAEMDEGGESALVARRRSPLVGERRMRRFDPELRRVQRLQRRCERPGVRAPRDRVYAQSASHSSQYGNLH